MEDIASVIAYLQRELRFLEMEGMHNDVLFRQGINSIYRSIDNLRGGMTQVERNFNGSLAGEEEGPQAQHIEKLHGNV